MKKILLQLDVDSQPCPFDAVVAVDAGVDVLLRHADVTPTNATALAHGAMFTRGGPDLASTGIFLGGSNVQQVEAVANQIKNTFFGEVRVSVMVDPAGANSTAAAAVIAAARHLPINNPSAAAQLKAIVLGGTGPVGQRAGRLLAKKGLHVTLVSRSEERALACCELINARQPDASVHAATTDALDSLMNNADVVIAAGAAGVELITDLQRQAATHCRIFIDLNAVPPAGIAGITAADNARSEGTTVFYGALGVGGIKMKIHRNAVASLFTTNDHWLDAEELLMLGEQLAASDVQPSQ